MTTSTSGSKRFARGPLVAFAACLLVGTGPLIAAVGLPSQISEPPATAEQAGSLRAVATPLIRLSSDQREHVFGGGSSLLGKVAQEEIGRLVRELENTSDGLLETAEIAWQQAQDPLAWVRRRTSSWPHRTPARERAILAALDSQVEVLDALLSTRDRDLAERLWQARQRIRIVPEDRRIFGDIRDRFVADVLEKLKQISLLQTALGATGETEWRFPSELQYPEQVESYVVTKLRFVAEKGRQLSD